MESLQELGLLLVGGCLVSLALAVLLSLSSGRSIGRYLIPAEVQDVVRTAWLGADIVDAQFEDRFGFLVSLANGLGAQLLLRAPRDGSKAWIYDERMDWNQLQTYRFESELRVDDLDASGPALAVDRPVVGRVEAALRDRSLRPEAGDAVDVLASCGVCRSWDRRDLLYLVVQLLDPRRNSVVWRGLARLETTPNAAGAPDLSRIGDHVAPLMANYPPVPERFGGTPSSTP